MYRQPLRSLKRALSHFHTPRTCFSLSAAAPEPANRHVTVDAEGKTRIDLTFESEALGMPAADGYGWPQFEFGDHIGPADRYKIARKLGWGMHSSTWLAHDTSENKYVAVKALTGYATHLYDRAITWEADALRLLSYDPVSPHCVCLLDEFTLPGRGSAGSHMCFVMPLYGGDVKRLQNSRTTPFPLPLAKRIALHLLRGLAYAHERGVVHTDLKHDNIFFFETKMSVSDIDDWIKRDPPRRHPPEESQDRVVQAAVSQPLPMISESDALESTYLLADWGCAQPSTLHDDRVITSTPLRPPEAFLGAAWDKPADIWTFGCLGFEFLTGTVLFRYQTNKKFDLTETENILYQMFMHTQEACFSADLLNVSPLAAEFFGPNCYLKKNPKPMQWPIEARFLERKVLSLDEATSAADLIRRCLRTDPSARATAAELLKDPCHGARTASETVQVYYWSLGCILFEFLAGSWTNLKNWARTPRKPKYDHPEDLIFNLSGFSDDDESGADGGGLVTMV